MPLTNKALPLAKTTHVTQSAMWINSNRKVLKGVIKQNWRTRNLMSSHMSAELFGREYQSVEQDFGIIERDE